ncbi:PREDICTED: microtubule-associated protein futsch-like [Populus euphratica]|uniref:Microtubule-associated protein futsch-like n=1 Tax=Populus euphratica TaxID=75702 RepID=A0AAJ6X4J3_POPEU|nr:PREDICTED: microtubule-associated protein futsch-like [Populus euphratica]
METEGLETVHTGLGGNAVVPEGGSFLEPPSIAKVSGEEIFRKQIDQVPCLVEKNERRAHEDEGFDTTEEGETKEIAEKEKQVDDVTGTILQMDKIEGPCVNIEEEEKIVKHVEAMEDGEAEVEGKPKSIEKEIGGPEKYEEGEMKIEESVELETSNEVSSFEPGFSQGKEALSQTADAAVNNLDNPETVKEVCQEKEIKDSGTGDGTINEQRIEEERKGEKSGSCSSFLDDKGTDVVKAIEKTENEKEGTTCDTIGGGTYIVEAGIDIQNEKETTPGTGQGMQDKRNTEDIATVTHKTQETEEMYSQQVDKPDECMVSESESEEIVNKSPQGEGQNLILEKTAEVDSSEGENIKDGMNPEQKPDGLFVKHEENKQSIHQDLAMTEESTEENRDMETPTVIAAENNTSDAVPITITTAHDHSVIEDDKIMDVVANIVPEHSKEEMSKYEDKIKETFAQQDEAANEKIENSLALISGEIDTATSSECSEAIASAKEETPIKIPGESFEDKKEEKPIDADAVVDSGLPIEKSLLPTDLNEKIEDAGLELQYKNSSELHLSHSLEQETIPVQDEKQPKLSDFEPQEQDHEENGPSKELEKHAEDASEACESMQNTSLENPSAEGAITTEVNSKANEMAVEKEEKIHELESEEKLAIDDAGTNLEEEMQKKEEAHDEQAYQMATSDKIEEVTSDEVCSREFVDKNVERSVQAAAFQEAETPSKNGVGENYEMSSIVNEEVIDEPNITDIGEVIDEEKIKDDATHLSSELVFDEKLVESSQDNETEAEMSKGDGVEEQMMKDDNAKVILQESIQEASVNDFQNDLKNAEKSSREMSEVSEAEEKDETNNNDESPDLTLQASLLKERESLQTENLTAEAEEKDEDGSSIRKDEDENNDDGLKEVKECSEKETLKGEEDVEQISPMKEPGEDLESSASMISAQTEEVDLNKTTQKTEEEMDEGIEGVKKPAETRKEDGEEQAIDENDAKSIPVKSIKEVTISELPNDENNAEEFKREISEESVAAGTNESIADATYQNDGTTPNAALETSTGKETLKVEENVEKISPMKEPGENLESSASMISAQTEEVDLKKTTQKTEEEMDEGIEGVKKPAETRKEDGEEQVIDENDAKSIPVKSIKEVTISDLPNDENNAEEFKREISEESVAAGTNEIITDATYQNDGTTPNAALETSTAKETLKDEEDVEQISSMNEPGENLESSASMISAEPEEVDLNKTTQKTEEEMDEGVEGVKKEAETGKEDGAEQVIDENDAKSIPVESIEEVPVSKLLNDENNAEEFKREISEESLATGTNESIIDATYRNDGSPNAALETSTVKQVEIVQGEGKDTIPAEASPEEEEEHDRARGFKRVGDNSREIKLEEDLEKSDEETSKKIDAVAHETNQHIEFPNSTLETSPVEEQESVQTDNLTPEETSPEEKKYEDGSSYKKDEDKEKNTGLAEETRNAGETLKAEESLEQILQDNKLIENPKQSINMICAETEADAFSKMVDNQEEEIVEIPRGNAEAELLKEENIEVHVVEESNINSLSQESAEESLIKDFQNAAKNSEKSTEEMLESQIAGGDETNTNDEDCSSSLTISVDKIDESFEGEDKNITTAKASTHDEKEEHGSLDRADDGNDSNPDLTVTNLDSAREASKVQEDSEQELQRIEPGEPEEPSTVMAAETEAGTLSDKIDDVTSQEEVVTVPNIEETVEKEKKEEHGPLDRADDENDSNPDLTVTNQDSAREASKVQEDSEQELQRIEPGEPEEPSTVMAAETEVGTLSDKIDDVTSQEEAVNIQNIAETVEKEKKKEHGPLDRADDGNDSNPDLTVTNLDSARVASKVQEDSKQELQRIEPGEPEESSTVMAAETEADTLSDKIDDITSQEEVVTNQNIEETIEKEKKEGSEDIDVTQVKRAVMEEDLKLVAEASDANKSVENDAEDENIISGGKEVETVGKKFELDSIQKLEVEEKRENTEEETKNEDVKEVCGDTKLGSLSVDAEKHVTTEEHANTDISPQTTGEKTAEEKAKTVKEMEESVITSVDEDAEKKVPEEESAINDQSRIIYKGDESGMLVEQEVHEIIQTAEYGDIGKQGSVIKDSYELPLSSTNEENPLHKETEDESDKVKPYEEVKDSKSEFTEPFEARGSVDRQEFETLRGKQGPNSDIYLVKASEGVSEKESNKGPIEISYLESESKGEILEEVQPDVNDSSSELTTGITRETSFKEAEPEDRRQIESFEPAPQEKGPVTESTERTTLESVDIDAKPEDSNFIENEDHGIPAASEAEELENEMHEETPITGSEDYKEETTNETSQGDVLDDKQVECSTMLPKEPELMTNEGNKATDENSTTYENIETPQNPQEIEIILKEDMPINARDASKSVDPRIESIKEEVGSYQFDSLNEHHELDNEKQEGVDISKSSEVRDLANQGEICKLMNLEDEYSTNEGDEALKCIEATSAERKEAILEEDNSTKKYEDSLADNVEANKAAFELEEGTNNQEQAIGTKDYGVLAEENFEVSESGKKLEGVSESETGDQSSQKIPETDPGKVENITEIQNKSLKSVEQSSLESQEVREETGEKTEPRFETEGDVKETQNTDETVKDVLLTEEVHEKVDKAGNETLKCTEKDVNDTLEPGAKSTEDERVHEQVKESSLIAEECHEATESNEQAAIMNSDFQETPTMEEMSLGKAINDEDNGMTAVLSTTKPAEESNEMIKIIKEEDSCCDKIKATTMVEITKTSLEEAQLDEKPVQVSNITSNDGVSLEIEAEACQQEKIKDNMGLELPSNLASPIPIDDHDNIMREQVVKESADADDVQENERASDVAYESKDHGTEELFTSKIKEENEKSSEIVESLGVEAAANEIAIDQNPPEVVSKEEQGISATTERREENMKDVELLEDDLRNTEEVPLQKDDCRERDISQLELQSNKDIQNQSPKEVLQEECETPDETKEEIKEGSKLVSITNSQGFEALKEDESTSGQIVPQEKLKEQNQMLAAALLSKEKDCGNEMIIENIEECVQVEIPTDPQNYSPTKIKEDTCLHKEETNKLEVSGFGVELNTGMQNDRVNEIQVEESKSPDDASKLQTPEYETSKEAFESMSEAHGHKGFTASEETEIEEKHLEVAITDLAAEEDRSEKIIDAAEIIHDEVIEEGTFERTSNLKPELSKEAFKSISEVHGHEALAESEVTEIKEKHPEVTVTDMAAEENQSERTIDATEIIHDKLKSEELTKRENQQIMEEKEGAKNGDLVTLVEETTKECQEKHELKAEESLGDEGTHKDIQNEELYKEVEKADGDEKQMDTERIIEHLHLAAADNETMKESFLDEAGSELHVENQICETAFGNDGRTEAANVKEEEMDVEISQKEVPTDLVEANEATRDIHEEEETSKTTTEHIEEHVKEVEIEVDEHPSAPKTTENTCSQKEETKEQEVCGSGVECSTDMQKNGSNEFKEEEGRTPDEDSTLQPRGYENKIKDKEYLPESNKMTEITETGAFEKTSDLRAETSEEAFKSVSEVHEHEVLAESEHAEIKKEKHTVAALTDLVARENQNKKTIDATEVVHDELTNEELTKQDKQQFKEEKEDTKDCNPINLGEETTKESRQIYDLKAEKSQEDKMENEIQNEEVSNESGEYLHQTAVEINENFPDEALVENAEDMGTKLQVENHSDEKISACDRTEATTITNEEFGTEISEKESLQAPAEAYETTLDIHQGERDCDSTSEKPIPIEAEPQETTERKKDAPQVLLQEPIVEATQGAGVGESEPGKATGIVDAQGFEHKAERSIGEENIRGNDEGTSAKTSLFDMMQSSTRERQVGGDLTEETRAEGEKTKSNEEKEEEEEEEGEEHKKTDSGSDAPVMVEASRDIVDVKVASKKHYNILSGVGSKVKNSISKVKKAITGKSSHPKQHSPKGSTSKT